VGVVCVSVHVSCDDSVCVFVPLRVHAHVVFVEIKMSTHVKMYAY